MGWHVHWHPATSKKGYSGTAIWSKTPIEIIGTGLDGEDPEGRVLWARTGGVEVISVYLPSGSADEARQARKEAWMDEFMRWATPLLARDTPVILGGDLNIAHTERDIHNAKGNQNNSGFLPNEREWFSELLHTGWDDVFRRYVGEVQGPYSWWSNRGRARELNRGWRIDYLLANSPGSQAFVSASILREGGLQISDHAPVIGEFNF
jgi:exodeoxyribonuclease-3